ncbi:5-formyltetrahydrofolate cyclo-ligase [Bacillus pseudomycoides]|uniref:YjdF family protein n=1 Tax=Bacillus pseudomycoides TaxID=64104 RepID=UPI000BF0FC08|nr:YjdF family protein [Bacillus pseudomycoides]PEI40249.1 5-formyltetrahydrofolate cyclo-ligase [Bacillus pseudomycoides]
MKLTVYHDGQFFVGMIEDTHKGILYAARYIFGAELSDEEILVFVNNTMLTYFNHFAKCGVKVEEKKRPKSIKRIIREAAKEMHTKSFTKAQEAISLSYELHKQEKRVQSKEQREAEKQKKRLIKVQKAKQKHRGH